MMKETNKEFGIYIPTGTYDRNEAGDYSRKNAVTVTYQESRSFPISKVIDSWISYIKECVIGETPFNKQNTNRDYIPFKPNASLAAWSPALKYNKPLTSALSYLQGR